MKRIMDRLVEPFVMEAEYIRQKWQEARGEMLRAWIQFRSDMSSVRARFHR
ncbi:MAG: hypothetical protein V1685_04105 [Parcubacteria group bacterium]